MRTRYKRVRKETDDMSEAMHDYNNAIADAAREYRKAYEFDELYRKDNTARDAREALGKLFWMIDAEKHNWNPALFDSF